MCCSEKISFKEFKPPKVGGSIQGIQGGACEFGDNCEWNFFRAFRADGDLSGS